MKRKYLEKTSFLSKIGKGAENSAPFLTERSPDTPALQIFVIVFL